MHPFNGYRTVLGTATLGYEWTSQAPDLEAVILPIGGGGLAAGVSTAMRLANPSIHVYGVEPEGADVMSKSFAANHTVKMGAMHSIADSLMAPHTEQYSYELCRRHIDQLVTVTDAELRARDAAAFQRTEAGRRARLRGGDGGAARAAARAAARQARRRAAVRHEHRLRYVREASGERLPKRPHGSKTPVSRLRSRCAA